MTQEDKQLSALKQAYLKLEALQTRLDAVERARQEPLAIIGMEIGRASCRERVYGLV